MKNRGRQIILLLLAGIFCLPLLDSPGFFAAFWNSCRLVLSALNLLDARLSIILPAIFSTFPVFLIYRFFKGIPQALISAADIDGAGPLQIFLYIGVPMGAPGIVSAMLLGFLEYWNVLEQPLVFLKDKTLWPLSLYLPGIVADKAALSLAASIIMLIPSLLIFLLGQKHLERGIRAAGLKE